MGGWVVDFLVRYVSSSPVASVVRFYDFTVFLKADRGKSLKVSNSYYSAAPSRTSHRRHRWHCLHTRCLCCFPRATAPRRSLHRSQSTHSALCWRIPAVLRLRKLRWFANYQTGTGVITSLKDSCRLDMVRRWGRNRASCAPRRRISRHPQSLKRNYRLVFHSSICRHQRNEARPDILLSVINGNPYPSGGLIAGNSSFE